MPTKRLLPVFILPAILFLSLAMAPDAWAAPTYKVLHSFGSGKDGLILYGSLVFDGAGNLYGTTSGGGAYGGGTVFQLTPNDNGKWAERILHSFHNDDPDGVAPSSTPIFDPQGNLYASTTTNGPVGTYGTVFKLTPGSDGWKLTVIHHFGRNDKVGGPWAGVIMDGAGNLYAYSGWAFELSPGSGGKWKEHILHRFPAFQGDGWGGLDHPILDAFGNLYGTTEGGGGSKNCGGGCGTVYELSPTSGGKWKEHILHRFGSPGDGAFPGVGALVLDGAGNVYGTAGGGNTGYGVIFRLSRKTDGRWKETVLYDIPGGANGDNPGAGVVRDKSGNLYGTTIQGGGSGCGVVYKLAPDKSGKWTYTVLHSFTGYDGCQPDANLILDDKGNLYGTAVVGGAYGGGVAFELTP